jgi:hypothetical protein
MMLKTHEVTREIETLDSMIIQYMNENEGEFPEFIEDELEKLTEKREQKLLNLAAWHKDLLAEANTYPKEIKRLQAEQKTLNNKAEWVKNYIDLNMAEGEEFKNIHAKLSYRKSTQVVLDVPVEDLPPEVVKISIAPDKVAIKKVIKNSSDCDYAHIETFQNLNIK